ncbi:hypothetical protein [Saccharopolyspora pogona]|uniref:hypothetical protein n=1 Tax=Saccharopolyspora pogona TaxID=333966 RepID=UPI00168A1F2D|nr:hypothetical protein [Saccharopolyspora pogona]
MPDQLTAWLRTIVPAAWSALIAWLITAGTPDWLTDPLGDAGPTLVVPIVLAAVYALLRWAEPRLPAWLARLLLGSATPPTYMDSRSTVE